METKKETVRETTQLNVKLVEALISKAESLMQRTRALDIRLLGKASEVELGEITRMQTVIDNAKEALKEAN